ncbi:MAG: hypothetical protein P9L89_02760 [Candidatus Celaenobacter polaris]|nr:hypothetical protein [Candidatus Celaenobacter polaris]
MKKTVSVFLIILFGIISIAQGDIIEDLKQFGEENGEKYMKPFVTAFGSDLNSGWFSCAKTSPMSFGLTFNAMLAVVPDDEKTFLIHNPDTTLFEGESKETATAFGNDGAVFISKVGGDPLIFPGGADVGMVPLIVPQAHLGLPGGFEVEVRYFPPCEIKDMGKISFVGGGVKYQVSKLIPMLSTIVPISIQGTYQQLKLGDEVTLNSTFVNIHASRELVILPLTIYGGIGYEHTTLKAKYTYTEPWEGGTTHDIDFNITGDNGFRVTAGACVKILLLDVMVDYSVGKYQTVRAGVGFSI